MSKSTEELVYEAWEIVKHDSLASSRIGSPSQATREKLAAFFDQELAKRVEEAELNQIDFIDEMFRIIGPDISKVLNACRKAIKPSLTNQTNKGEK